MPNPSCKTCKHCVIIDGEKGDGACRRYPPQFTGPTQTTFPGVNIVTFWCGEHAPKRVKIAK